MLKNNDNVFFRYGINTAFVVWILAFVVSLFKDAKKNNKKNSDHKN